MESSHIRILVILLIGAMMQTGCGGGGSGHNDDLAKDESFYEVGASVKAVDFSDAQKITLYEYRQVDDSKFDFVKVANGDVLAPGKHKFGIDVTQRKINGYVASERVFIGDGGNEYQVQALLDDDSGFYVCEYQLAPSDYILTCPILIQVIYEDALASKEKFVVRTAEEMAAPAGMLVDNGIGISLSKNMLKQAVKVVNPLIAEQVKGVSIQDLSPATGEGSGIIHVDLGSIGCDISIKDQNKNARGLYLGLEKITGGSGGGNILNAVVSAIIKGLLGKKGIDINGISVGALGFDIAGLISGFAGPADPDSEDPLAGILTGLKIDSVMFLNLKGLPDSTTENNAAIGGSLYAAPSKEVEKDKNGSYIWPSVTGDMNDTGMDMAMLQGDIADIGIALSDYNLNQVLSSLMSGFSIEIKDIQKLTDFFAPEDPKNSMNLTATINPGGIAIDMTTQRVAVNDVRLTLVEAGRPRTQLSLDVTLKFEAGFHADEKASYLDLTIAPEYERCRIHIMKDNMSMDMFDHSLYFPLIIEGFANGFDEIKMSLPLSDFGILPKAGIDPGEVKYDNSGNCYLKMAVGDLDASKLPTSGLCFINTATN
jgi:hypothetical protein